MESTGPLDRPSSAVRRSSSTRSSPVNARGSVNTPICRSQENAHATSPLSRNAMTPLVVGSDTQGLYPERLDPISPTQQPAAAGSTGVPSCIRIHPLCRPRLAVSFRGRGFSATSSQQRHSATSASRPTPLTYPDPGAVRPPRRVPAGTHPCDDDCPPRTDLAVTLPEGRTTLPSRRTAARRGDWTQLIYRGPTSHPKWIGS